MRKVLAVVALASVGMFPIDATYAAQEAIPAPAAGDADENIVLAPSGDLYRPYLADPSRVGFEILPKSFSRSEVLDSGDSRIGLKAGGRLGIARYDDPDRYGEGWQVGIEFGFIGEFDLDRSYDNLGWDGVYGATFTSSLSATTQAKLGLVHRSSHVGDEYIERTGRHRIGYMRDEVLMGLSWNIMPAWRVYGEYGHAFNLNDAVQERGRAQGGLEYQPRRQWWGGQLGWFAAIDVSATEERDWQADTAIRAGYLFGHDGRRWSLSGVYYHGRPSISEFFQHTESYVGVSINLDL